ncbi:hypothetical protein Sjap_008878 [Stephania japonica]|uniref:CCHC-type domain-containing protein n=1 Tax=Stephania japonica TaxID=461633 RepID=A0AAP0JQX1_9MAGN
MVKDFMRFNPTYFTESVIPRLRRWLMTHRRLHQLLEVPEADQARISGYCLRGQAAVWWTTYTDIHATPATWGEFRQLFLDEYIPIEVQLRLREQFLGLRQGNMSVSQYMDRFRYLMMYAMDVANSERLQIYYFIRGLDERIGGVIVATGAETLQIVYDRALARETYLLQIEEQLDHRTPRDDLQLDHDFSDDRDSRDAQYDYDDGQIDWSREDDQDQTNDQFNNDDHQVVQEIVPIPIQQPRQLYIQNQDQRDRSWGQRSEDQTIWSQDGRKCYRCGQRGHISVNCPGASPVSEIPPTGERTYEMTHSVRKTT